MKSKLISVLFALILSATGSPAEHHHALQRRNFPLPLPSCTPYTPWHYVGCFVEGDPTFLVYNTELTFETMTIEICIDSCKVPFYAYEIFIQLSADMMIGKWIQIRRLGILWKVFLRYCPLNSGR